MIRLEQRTLLKFSLRKKIGCFTIYLVPDHRSGILAESESAGRFGTKLARPADSESAARSGMSKLFIPNTQHIY